MAPSATSDSAFTIPDSKRPAERVYPPAKIFPPREAKFENPIPVQPDGLEKARAQTPGSAAIVIDNGTSAPPAFLPTMHHHDVY